MKSTQFFHCVWLMEADENIYLHSDGMRAFTIWKRMSENEFKCGKETKGYQGQTKQLKIGQGTVFSKEDV